MRLAFLADSVLVVLGSRGVCFEGLELFLAEFGSLSFEFGRTGFEIFDVPVKDGRDDPVPGQYRASGARGEGVPRTSA